MCPRAEARSQGVAGENSVTVSQYTPETFSNAREKFAQGIGGGCASQRTRISTWSLRFLPPFSNNPLSRTTIRGVLVAFARGREQESRRGVCCCVCPHGREGLKLTYDKFNALLPVLPSFLPALTPMALGHAGYYYFHSFPHVCLSVSSV